MITQGIPATGTFAMEIDCNWWGSACSADFESLISDVTLSSWLTGDGDDSGLVGFQPTATCVNTNPVVTISGNESVCINSENEYTTQSDMSNYVWNVVGGTITLDGGLNDNTATVTWNTAGVQSISVSYTNSYGCTPATPVELPVMVNPLPTATIAADQTQSVCSGVPATIEVVLTGTAPWSITYTDGTSPVTVSYSGASPYIISVNPTSNTTYTVTSVTDANCSNTANSSARIYVGPITTIGSIADACPESDVEVPVTVTSFAEVGAISLTIKYNPALLEYKGSELNADIEMENLAISNNPLTGIIKIGGFIAGNENPALGEQPVSLPDGAELCNLTFEYAGGDDAIIEFIDSPDPTDCNYGFGKTDDFTDFCDTPFGTYYINGKITEDDNDPILTVEENQNVNLNGSCAIIVPDLIDGSTAIDDCNYTFTQLPTIGTVVSAVHNEEVEVIVTVTDASGNSDEATVVLTAIDLTNPELTAEANQDVTLDAGCQITVPDVTGSATDNCAGTVITSGPG